MQQIIRAAGNVRRIERRIARWGCHAQMRTARGTRREELQVSVWLFVAELVREGQAMRVKICRIDGCGPYLKGARGMCGKHAMRVKRYGDPNHITPREEWRIKCREAQVTLGTAQPHVYRKLLGRHEHRMVAEIKLGRPLRPGEIVHHLDGDKHNNSPSNLEIMSQSQHAKAHWREMMDARKLKHGY